MNRTLGSTLDISSIEVVRDPVAACRILCPSLISLSVAPRFAASSKAVLSLPMLWLAISAPLRASTPVFRSWLSTAVTMPAGWSAAPTRGETATVTKFPWASISWASPVCETPTRAATTWAWETGDDGLTIMSSAEATPASTESVATIESPMRMSPMTAEALPGISTPVKRVAWTAALRPSSESTTILVSPCPTASIRLTTPKTASPPVTATARVSDTTAPERSDAMISSRLGPSFKGMFSIEKFPSLSTAAISLLTLTTASGEVRPVTDTAPWDSFKSP